MSSKSEKPTGFDRWRDGLAQMPEQSDSDQQLGERVRESVSAMRCYDPATRTYDEPGNRALFEQAISLAKQVNDPTWREVYLTDAVTQYVALSFPMGEASGSRQRALAQAGLL